MTFSLPAAATEDHGPRGFDRARLEEQRRFEHLLLALPSPDALAAHHEALSSKPHLAGSAGDAEVVRFLSAYLSSLGLKVEKQALDLYLARPIAARLDLISPEVKNLPIQEDVLEEDPYSGHPGLAFGWNAYSGSGGVEGEIVYGNRGTKEDFEKLAELGIDLHGKIVVVRYGGNYRGFKAKFAEEHGAAGLIIYTDPADSGYARGLMYPEGGYANPSFIQRGSVLTLPYPGDPLTPFTAAIPNAERLRPEEVALPKIPIQPVGWQSAEEILSRMQGEAVPRGWQGGLPFAYRVTGGPELRVRLKVLQERKLMRTHNVVATLRGSVYPNEKVILGAHHDAWTFGAGDPNAGSIVVLEAARSFAEAAKRGHRPERSIVFAHWAAEEFGIIGSVEWIEAHADDLSKNAVAYINLDMAAMGMNFRSSASPTLKRAIFEAARTVHGEHGNIGEAWRARGSDPLEPDLPAFGSLGGGSDHVGFYCHLGIPSAGIGAGGSPGVSYHSNYENLAWYRKIVGSDYASGKMVTSVVNILIARLAGADLLPLPPHDYAVEFRRHLDRLEKEASVKGMDLDFSSLRKIAAEFESRARGAFDRMEKAVASGTSGRDRIRRANDVLRTMERSWLHKSGLSNRPWFRSMLAATDEDSGYAAWMLPALRHAVEHRDRAALERAEKLYALIFERLGKRVEILETLLAAPAPSAAEQHPPTQNEKASP